MALLVSLVFKKERTMTVTKKIEPEALFFVG